MVAVMHARGCVLTASSRSTSPSPVQQQAYELDQALEGTAGATHDTSLTSLPRQMGVGQMGQVGVGQMGVGQARTNGSPAAQNTQSPQSQGVPKTSPRAGAITPSPAQGRRSRIPRSVGGSREASPTRAGNTSGADGASSGRMTPSNSLMAAGNGNGMAAGNGMPVGSPGSGGAVGSSRTAPNTPTQTAPGLSLSGDTGGLQLVDVDGCDAFSETASLCSEHSYRSFKGSEVFSSHHLIVLIIPIY